MDSRRRAAAGLLHVLHRARCSREGLRTIGRAFCAAPAVAPQGASVDLPRRRLVTPLPLTERVLLYDCPVDMQGTIARARQRCLIGAGLGVGGIGIIVASAAGTMPLPACAMLLGGAAAYAYGLSVIARRLLRSLAARHVERLAVLPAESASAAAEDALRRLRQEQEQHGLAASLLFSAATIEERLSATVEVCVEVRTATANRWLKLADLPENDEHYGGFDEDSLGAPFSDICGRVNLLHFDLEERNCLDHAFLAALLASGKRIVDERIEPRSDATPLLADPPVQGPMLSEIEVSDIEQAAKSVSKDAPADVVSKIGRRARLGGLSVFGAGVFFAIGESAKGPDGVPRWGNLNLPL